MSFSNISALSGIPLNTLRVFEAAARHRNMVRAAAELGLTQGAVSRQVKDLERRIGVLLFRRGPRGLALTEAGDLLADYVVRAFGELTTGLYRIGQPRQRTTLVVAAPRSFALRVLAPRLGNFTRQHPWIDLRLDTHRYYADLEQSGADIAIRAGDGNWTGHHVERLTRDVLFPICAPALWPNENSSAHGAEFLRQQTLLHYAERPYWPAWLKSAEFDLDLNGTGPIFSETALMLAAAEAGQGIAIGRASLVKDALAMHRLVRPFDISIDDGVSYFLVIAKAVSERSTIKAFTDWILAELMPGRDQKPVA